MGIPVGVSCSFHGQYPLSPSPPSKFEFLCVIPFRQLYFNTRAAFCGELLIVKKHKIAHRLLSPESTRPSASSIERFLG
jgi:hypothetical protein